jgi:MFS family permease
MWAGMEKDASTRPLASAWLLFAYGIVAAVLATGLASLLADTLLASWEQGHDSSIYPEGTEYAFLAFWLRAPIDFIMFLLVFGGLVPFVYADHRRVNERKPIVSWRLALIGATLASLVWIAFSAFGGLSLVAAVAGPTFLCAALGVLVLTSIANQELRRGDGGAGEA